jgi:hypothetical protein
VKQIVNTIPADVVAESWARLNESSETEARALAQKMQAEQPFIMVYLLAAEESMLEEEERGSLLMLGANVWQVMAQAGLPLRQVTAADLEAAEEANIRILEDMEQDSEFAQRDAMSRLVNGYNQMPLLGAVVEALMAGHEDAPELAPQHVGLALIHLKTVIDCLDQ